MTTHIYLVGVFHQLQCRNTMNLVKSQEIACFQDFVKNEILKYEVSLLAEEFSTEACKINGVECSTIQDVARELNIDHLFCDPTTDEREKCGISHKDWDKREEFWLTRLIEVCSHQEMNIVFICGIDHLDRFQSKLISSSFDAKKISEKEWGKDLTRIYFN